MPVFFQRSKTMSWPAVLRRWRRIAWRALQGFAAAVICFVLLDCLFPVNTEIAYAPLVKDRNGHVLHAFLAKDEQWRFRTELSEITPELKQAILFKEDKHFYQHFGVDPFAVCRAVFSNLFHHRRMSGASTITMQVARLLRPKERTYGNKLVEMFRALQLETHYSKAEILQLYLNLVPYGSNIQGVKAASLLYFGKSPDQLSLAELTALSIIPNRPNALVIGRDNARIMVERNKWLHRFEVAALFPKTTIDDALAEPLTAYRHPAPDAAPQLSWRLRFAHPDLLEIRSSIDAGKQMQAEQIVHNYVQTLKLQNVFNAAVLVVDNRSHEVLVYIGSPDFSDRAHQGQVDGVKALRSPGSTLKPFLYGLAYDAGLATPQTVVNDVPVNLAGYTPENYDLQFRGPVSVEDALRQSLNIPAVKTLQQLGVPRFTQALSAAGFRSVWQQRKKVGLSIILGGCTVRLEELVTLFSGFADGGAVHALQWSPVAVREDTNRWATAPRRPLPTSPDGGGGVEKGAVDAPEIASQNEGSPNTSLPFGEGRGRASGFRILSPSANFMVSKNLCELTRPDLPNLPGIMRGIPKIAWKTGTSYGRKDAWSIGFNGHYTIGVWLGNFDGKGVTALSGAATATPLLFQLFNALDPRAGEEWLTAPRELARRFVCKESGLLPSEHCTETVMDYYIPGVSPMRHCGHLREVWVSADGAFSYCTSCLPAAGYKTKLYPNLAPELAAFYDARGVRYERIPPHNPACGRLFGEGQAPLISTLQAGTTYLIVDKGKQQLQLGCQAAPDVRKVYWYINDRFFAAADAKQRLFFKPEGAAVKVSCADDKGRVSDVEVRVKYL
jgi:penicillin-binding protein 1C